MAYYRFNPSGLTLLDVLERLKTLHLHLQQWGVGVTGLKMTSAVVWMQTNIDIPPAKFSAIQAEVGMVWTKTTTEPTTAP